MSGAAGYLLRLICGAFVCALVLAIAGDGPGGGIRKLVAGVFLAFLALSPLGEMELPRLDLEEYRQAAEAAVREGTDQADDARFDIISHNCEAYILNKAAELDLSLTVQVHLDGEGMPDAVTLTGPVSPAERENLSSCIARDLGLGKEAQTWIDPYQSSASTP